jgi:hypothetical protein
MLHNPMRFLFVRVRMLVIEFYAIFFMQLWDLYHSVCKGHNPFSSKTSRKTFRAVLTVVIPA